MPGADRGRTNTQDTGNASSPTPPGIPQGTPLQPRGPTARTRRAVATASARETPCPGSTNPFQRRQPAVPSNRFRRGRPRGGICQPTIRRPPSSALSKTTRGTSSPSGFAHASGRHTLAGAAPGIHRDLACLWQPWRSTGERSGIPGGSVFLPSLPNWCAPRFGLLWRTVRFSPRGQRHERESRRPLPPEAGAPQIGSAEPRSGPGSSSTRRR